MRGGLRRETVMLSTKTSLLLALVWSGPNGATSSADDFASSSRNDLWASSGQIPFRVDQESVEGHADFGDGRKRTVSAELADPACEGCFWTNVMLGNGGCDPVRSGIGERPADDRSVRVLISAVVSH